MYIFSLRSNVYQIKINMKNSMNKSVCLWYCAISGEVVELYTYRIILIRLEIRQMVSYELSRRKVSRDRTFL